MYCVRHGIVGLTPYANIFTGLSGLECILSAEDATYNSVGCSPTFEHENCIQPRRGVIRNFLCADWEVVDERVQYCMQVNTRGLETRGLVGRSGDDLHS